MSISITIPSNDKVALPTKMPDDGDELQKMLRQRIAFLLKLPHNQFCVDCCRPSPRWVSLITIDPSILDGETRSIPSFLKRTTSNLSISSRRPAISTGHILPLGCFCCLECSGSHRRLGTHITFVRSVDLDSFKEREVQALEFAGNATVNGIFEAHLLDTSQDCDTGAIRVSFRVHDREIIKRCGGSVAWDNNTKEDRLSREAFIRDKYDRKLFVDYNALRRIYSHPTYMKSGSGCIVYTVKESHRTSSTSDTESVSGSSSDIQLKVFTSTQKTMESINKYMRENPATPSNEAAKDGKKAKESRMPPRHSPNNNHAVVKGPKQSDVPDIFFRDVSNIQLDQKSSPSSSVQKISSTDSPAQNKMYRNKTIKVQPGNEYDGGREDCDNCESPLLDNSVIVSLDYEETAAYEVVYQGFVGEVARGDVLNSYGQDRTTGRAASDPRTEGSKNETRSNSRLRRVLTRNDNVRSISSEQKDGNSDRSRRSSSTTRNRNNNEIPCGDMYTRSEQDLDEKISPSSRSFFNFRSQHHLVIGD